MTPIETIIIGLAILLAFLAIIIVMEARRRHTIEVLKAEHETDITDSMAAAYLEGARRTAIHAAKARTPKAGKGLSALITCL